MRANYDHLSPLIEQLDDVPGEFAEFGVWQGATFLAMAAANPDRVCHAVDSFQGMPAPGPHDNGLYPRGQYDVGGSGPLYRASQHLSNVRIHEGFVPHVLQGLEIDGGIAFAHVDLDHYEPTLAALLWCWRHLNPGGILVSHDYIVGRDFLAAGGCNAFTRASGIEPEGTLPSLHIWWRKTR